MHIICSRVLTYEYVARHHTKSITVQEPKYTNLHKFIFLQFLFREKLAEVGGNNFGYFSQKNTSISITISFDSCFRVPCIFSIDFPTRSFQSPKCWLNDLSFDFLLQMRRSLSKISAYLTTWRCPQTRSPPCGGGCDWGRWPATILPPRSDSRGKCARSWRPRIWWPRHAPLWWER